jgi:hypothetical protein
MHKSSFPWCFFAVLARGVSGSVVERSGRLFFVLEFEPHIILHQSSKVSVFYSKKISLGSLPKTV